jgi:hypothetical protein
MVLVTKHAYEKARFGWEIGGGLAAKFVGVNQLPIHL